jgi:hypothetical protein
MMTFTYQSTCCVYSILWYISCTALGIRLSNVFFQHLALAVDRGRGIFCGEEPPKESWPLAGPPGVGI